MSVSEPPLDSPEIRRLSPVLAPGHTYATVTDKIAAIVLTRRVSLGWLAGFGIAFTMVMVLNLAVGWLIIKGVGIWGINIPIGWGFAIVNFVWWIGIGHAGTLISAILFLLNQKWRTSINRFAEAMTLFAVACAGLFPLIHTGRPWMAYYMFPYPSTMGLWPQFRSPLIWDVFAVSTYGTVSALFWFVGLIPDLATLRDHAIGKPLEHQAIELDQHEPRRPVDLLDTVLGFVARADGRRSRQSAAGALVLPDRCATCQVVENVSRICPTRCSFGRRFMLSRVVAIRR